MNHAFSIKNDTRSEQGATGSDTFEFAVSWTIDSIVIKNNIMSECGLMGRIYVVMLARGKLTYITFMRMHCMPPSAFWGATPEGDLPGNKPDHTTRSMPCKADIISLRGHTVDVEYQFERVHGRDWIFAGVRGSIPGDIMREWITYARELRSQWLNGV